MKAGNLKQNVNWRSKNESGKTDGKTSKNLKKNLVVPFKIGPKWAKNMKMWAKILEKSLSKIEF